MSNFLVTDQDGVEQFVRPTSIAKARRMAKQLWLDANPDVAPYVRLYFSRHRDGSESLAVDDGISAWSSGIKVSRQK